MAVGNTGFVGEVITWAGPLSNFSGVVEPISGWLLCNGAGLGKTDPKYTSLQSKIGIIYGSDTNNFFLPNLTGKFPAGASTYALGGTGGEYSHVLTTTEIPSHSHTVNNLTPDGGHVHSSSVNSSNESANHTHNAHIYYVNAHEGTSTTYDLYALTGTAYNIDLYEGATDASAAHTHTVATNTTGSHTHTIGLNNAGNAVAHENMPAYVCLHYLIRY